MNRIKGMLYGEALGDALGAPHEFRNQKKNYNGKLDKPIVTNSQWQGQFVSAVGQITDDTEMSLCIWQSLIDNGFIYEQNSTIMKYLEWANTKGTWAMGINTRALLHGVKTLKGYQSRRSKNDGVTQSNGGLMRCSPLAVLGYYNKDTWRDAVIKDVDITNPNDICRIVNKIYVKAIILALKNKSKHFIYQTMLKMAKKSKFQIIINTIKWGKGESHAIIKNKLGFHDTKGWCIIGLLSACWALFQFDNYHSAIDAIILCNGDTDTNAKIAGALIGAFYGLKQLERHPRTKKNIKVLKACDTDKGDRARPERYSIQLLESIIPVIEQYI